MNGKPFKVVKYATDITEQKVRAADFEGQLAAISSAQAVIEFELDGTIRSVNDNFAQVMGYSNSEVRGKHHSMFVDPAISGAAEYRAFWAKLGRGEADAGRYRRVAKGGREVWLQASYNPILDANGRPFKVVKYATDVTEQMQMAQQLELTVQADADHGEGRDRRRPDGAHPAVRQDRRTRSAVQGRECHARQHGRRSSSA